MNHLKKLLATAPACAETIVAPVRFGLSCGLHMERSAVSFFVSTVPLGKGVLQEFQHCYN